MDSSLIAAWAALVVASVALVVAAAQAIQQYAATAHSMRTCENSVSGPMPGSFWSSDLGMDSLPLFESWGYEMPNLFISNRVLGNAGKL